MGPDKATIREYVPSWVGLLKFNAVITVYAPSLSSILKNGVPLPDSRRELVDR